ncbi:ABC transporter A family member 7-like [Typha latifolia]|uniref:ABC transporter A family member 7-like n=1 Tax=Typha latifolia TaxID=4733 RepID=UPI003C303626
MPDHSCRKTLSCPATVLFTGENQSLANSLASNLFTSATPTNLSDFLSALSLMNPGTDTSTGYSVFIEPAFASGRSLYLLQPLCGPNSTYMVPIQIGKVTIRQEIQCVQGSHVWRGSSAEINDELFKGYRRGNGKGMTNEVVSAYDFSNSNENNFNVTIWYNSTYKNETIWRYPGLMRVPRSVNMVSNSYLQLLRGVGSKVLLEFVKEMPKPATHISLDLSSLLGALFYKWVIELLLPVILTYLVYEKQHKLRIMMKMHGLADGPYWIISYAYFLLISVIYLLFLVIFGSFIGLNFFRLNDYSLQFVFYFTYANLQILLAFILAAFFSDVKTAQAITYIYIFGSGFLVGYLFRALVEDTSFSRYWVWILEMIPAFSLYRGLYEFSQYSFNGAYMATFGMRWNDLDDVANGLKEVMKIMAFEWLLLLPVAYYADKIALIRRTIRNYRIVDYFRLKTLYVGHFSVRMAPEEVVVQVEKPDVIKEREIVEDQLHKSTNERYAIICDKLKKVFPGRDGNKNKIAVQDLSLALLRGECFGLLGPNGAGKTTIINMMTGLTKPTSGNTLLQGLSIETNFDKIYTSIGVCPQKDMIWEMLTAREHLLFYGRLKNLQGSQLINEVEQSLGNVELQQTEVADKQVKTYSGGMKRRLSIAISLIGDPRVVYMDEPSTGLDPATRKLMWQIVERAKQNRAIILTTHSMEEAELLCDRLGIFVNGNLQCIGTSSELKARYGGSYVFCITTSLENEENVVTLVHKLSPDAKRIYSISGSQKFELPKNGVRIADIFRAVQLARERFTVYEWGLADTTMEDVFIKVTKGAESVDVSHDGSF